ncbi:Far-red impaired responsive family protein, partial [Prunus dulcis]
MLLNRPDISRCFQLLSDALEWSVRGFIQYLTFTRPDISFVVNHVAQFMSAPCSPHLVVAKVPLALDSPLVSHGPLILCGFNTRPHTLHGFFDADWAGCPDTRRSTTSFFVFLGPNVISWSAKKQHTVSHSSAKAEYQSLAHVCADTTWISYLHHELAIPSSGPTLLICDNMSTTHMASN